MRLFLYTQISDFHSFSTDASDKRIGVVLSQIGKYQLEHPIAYFSRTVGKQERNYLITRKELLAAIEGIEHFK